MGEFRRAAAVATEFGISAHEAVGLREQGLGWGEVRDILAISKRSGRPVTEIMKLRELGLGLVKIAQRFGFQAGQPRSWELVDARR